MNFRRREKSIVDILFLLALFAVFMVSALFIILFGAKIYKSTVNNMENNFTHRTSLSYVTEKVRQHDYDNGIEVSEYNGTPLFIFNQFYNGNSFSTYLYAHEGYLKEQTINSEYDFIPENGQSILKINSFTADLITDSLYKCEIENDTGETVTFYVSSYSNKDGGDYIE